MRFLVTSELIFEIGLRAFKENREIRLKCASFQGSICLEAALTRWKGFLIDIMSTPQHVTGRPGFLCQAGLHDRAWFRIFRTSLTFCGSTSPTG